MKKNKIVLLCFFIGIFIFSGCSNKGLDEKEVSKVFIEDFIYHKETEKFKENFVEGDILSKQLTIMTTGVEDTFSGVFLVLVHYSWLSKGAPNAYFAKYSSP